MSAILKFDFQKREKLRFSEVNYLNYTKKTTFSIKQGDTRISHGPTPHPLKAYSLISYRGRSQKFENWNFLHLFVAFLPKVDFPKGI